MIQHETPSLNKYIQRLCPEALTDYPELSDLLPGLQSALDKVERAFSLRSQVEDKPHETVLDHLVGEYGIIPILEDCFLMCPTLEHEIDKRKVLGEIVLHDWPETVVKDHDHASQLPLKHHLNGNKERAERIAFHTFLLPLISNSDLKSEVLRLYTDFIELNGKEAKLTLVLDRFAGNYAVISQYINRELEAGGYPITMASDRINQHVIRHAQEASEFAVNFARSGLSIQAQIEWYSWFSNKFRSNYTKTGHDQLLEIQALIDHHKILLLDAELDKVHYDR